MLSFLSMDVIGLITHIEFIKNDLNLIFIKYTFGKKKHFEELKFVKYFGVPSRR